MDGHDRRRARAARARRCLAVATSSSKRSRATRINGSRQRGPCSTSSATATPRGRGSITIASSSCPSVAPTSLATRRGSWNEPLRADRRGRARLPPSRRRRRPRTPSGAAARRRRRHRCRARRRRRRCAAADHRPGDAAIAAAVSSPSVDRFDAAFFGISPREARGHGSAAAPAARGGLGSAGGRRPSRPTRSAARAPASSSASPARLRRRCSSREPARSIDAYTGTGNALSFAAGRLSLRARPARARAWPSTRPARRRSWRCTSPCQSLRARRVRPGAGRRRQPDPVARAARSRFARRACWRPTAAARPSTRAADGYVRGEGCGVVVLKRLSRRASRDGDRMLARDPRLGRQPGRPQQRAHRAERAGAGGGDPRRRWPTPASRPRRRLRRGARHGHAARRPDRVAAGNSSLPPDPPRPAARARRRRVTGAFARHAQHDRVALSGPVQHPRARCVLMFRAGRQPRSDELPVRDPRRRARRDRAGRLRGDLLPPLVPRGALRRRLPEGGERQPGPRDQDPGPARRHPRPQRQRPRRQPDRRSRCRSRRTSCSGHARTATASCASSPTCPDMSLRKDQARDQGADRAAARRAR